MGTTVRLHEILPSRPQPDEPVARVAVVVSLNFPDMDEQVAELVRRFTRVALETLCELGAAFELFDTSAPLRDPEAIRRCDGLMLLGGGDVAPSCYNASLSEVRNGYGIDERADRDALDVIGIAERADMPILGICRGAQLINVHRGGTIIPDIEEFALHRGGPGEPMFLDETITIEPDTRLRAIVGTECLVVRSGHHQAVDDVGHGLVTAARALDGIVEAIEDPARFIVGVQWHPEDDDGPAEDRLRLMRAFVQASSAKRDQRRIDHQGHTTFSALR